MSARQPPEPKPRGETVREELLRCLGAGPATAHDLSRAVGVSEKDVLSHLEHLDRSLRAKGGRLTVEPASCVDCGFVFRDRARLGKPGACPKCRGTHLDPPRFHAAT